MRTIDKKVTEDGRRHYSLKKFGDKFSIYSVLATSEAEIGDCIGTFNNENHAYKAWDELLGQKGLEK